MKKQSLIIGCCLLVISLVFFVFHFYFNLKNIPTSPLKAEKIDFEISPGMSFNEIAEKLKNESLIQSETVFKIYGALSMKARQLKPGRYVLVPNLSVSELVAILIKGPKEIPVIIAPGLTLKEIDDKLSEVRIIKSGELINFEISASEKDYPFLAEADSLEGFLFPDTYNFFLGSGADLVIHRFLDNFKNKALSLFESSDKLLDKLILASILEKEIPDYEEKKIVAGILLKRLKTGMPLQVDASVVYAKCFGRFLNCGQISKADYKINSVYNTYFYSGLPKGPIANPGLESIRAILNSKKTEYWYYLSDPKTKKTIFSKTLDEHNKNRVIYLLNR